MLQQMLILAARRATVIVSDPADPTITRSGAVRLPDHWPVQGDLLSWCQQMGPGLAALLILAGVVYLLFGYSWFKGLVMLNAIIVGAALGAAIGDKAGAEIPGAVVGAAIAGALSWLMINYAVAIMGASFGAMIGALVWQTAGLDPGFTWSGALSGMILCGLLSFIVFRSCLMAYTSLQGSVMLIFGILGLIFKYQDLAPKVGAYMMHRSFILPLCIFIPALVGMIYQQATNKPSAAPAKK